MRLDPKFLREWKNILLWEKPFLEVAISKIREPKFTKELVSIIIPKTIMEAGERDLQNTLVGRFVGVRPLIELIQRLIQEIWSTKGPISLIVIPKKFLIFKFQFKQDLQKVIELGPWFLGKKGLIIKH